jgi:hypothetical protein
MLDGLGRVLINRDCSAIAGRRKRLLAEAQAIFCRRRHQPRRPPPANIRPGSPAPAIGPGTATAVVATSRISLSPGAGASPVTFTEILVAVKVKPAIPTGRKSAALAGLTATALMSTPDENLNPKPVKMSGHGDALPEQNGMLGGAILVIVIAVSPTSIVDRERAPSRKWTGMVGGGLLVGP